MRIISKYVLKEHLGPLVFALSALTSLLLLNYIAKQFEKLVGKGLPWSVIGEFFMLSVPFTVAMTLPMAVLVSTLYAFSRLAAENEITALKASGVSMTRVIAPVLVGATFLAGLMTWFNDQVLPAANHRLSVLQQDIGRVKPTLALRERVMNELSPGRTYLKPNYLDPATNRMREVTIIDFSNPANRRTIHADSGLLAMSESQTDLLLTLYDGYLQEMPSREPGQLQRHFFETNQIRVRGVGNSLVRTEGGGYKGDREMSICEMQAAVNEAYGDYTATREALEEFLAREARGALTGTGEDEPFRERRPAARAGLGQAYCSMLAAIRGERGERADSVGENLAGVESANAPPAPLAERPVFASASEPSDEPERIPIGEPIRQAPVPVAGQAPVPLRGGLSGRPRAGRPVREPGQVIRNEEPDGIIPTPPDSVRKRPDRDSARTAVTAARYPVTPNAMRRLEPVSAVSGRIEAMRSQLEIAHSTIQRYDVEIQKKFALAVACVVFVLLGAPVALRFPRGGVGMTLGVSLIVFAIYYIGLIGGEALADRGLLTPFWAMWAANAIFAAAGLILLSRMGREGATTRGGDFGELREAVRVWIARQGRKVGIPLDRRRHRA